MKNRIIPFLALLIIGGTSALYTSGCSAMTGKSTGEYIDDATITAKVKTDLIRDPVVKAREINVDTNGGVVQLNGTVDNAQQRMRAEQIARSVSGVQNVEDNLAVRPPSAQ